MIKKGLGIFLLFCCFHSSFGMDMTSEWKAWKNTKSKPETRLKAVDNLIWDGYMNTDVDSAYLLCQEMLVFAKSSGNKKYTAQALHNLGSCFYFKGEFKRALEHFEKALVIRKELKDFT